MTLPPEPDQPGGHAAGIARAARLEAYLDGAEPVDVWLTAIILAEYASDDAVGYVIGRIDRARARLAEARARADQGATR